MRSSLVQEVGECIQYVMEIFIIGMIIVIIFVPIATSVRIIQIIYSIVIGGRT